MSYIRNSGLCWSVTFRPFIITNISIISIKWPPVIVFVDTDQKPISAKVVACYRFFWYWFWIPGRYNAGASSKAQALRLDQDLEEKIRATGRRGIKGWYFTFDLRDKLEDVVEGGGGFISRIRQTNIGLSNIVIFINS